MADKLRLGVFKFASCDGCQLSLLNAEEELLQLVEHVEIVYFLEASSHQGTGPFDISLVEGSISTPEDHERIQDIRRRSETLITIGACATAGGIQALRNGASYEDFVRAVYPHPEFISSLETSTPISQHVQVDFELHGCPINTRQLLQILSDKIHNRRLSVPNHTVCRDCKLSGTVCVTVARGIPCLGPITQAGCGAICPEYSRGCYGCYGPGNQVNPKSLTNWLTNHDHAPQDLVPLLQNFNAAAPEFSKAANNLQGGANE